MLLDTISILLGFVGIMLALSLVVTGLVQLGQSLLRVRALNLRFGLEALVERWIEEAKKKARAAGAPEPAPADARKLTQEMMCNCQFVPRDRKLVKWLSPPCTWVTLDQLIAHLKDLNLFGEEDQTKMATMYKHMGNYLSKRFKLYARLITVVCAFLVAAYFQVNSIELLQRLVNDRNFRATAVQLAEELDSRAEPSPVAVTNVPSSPALALEELTARHPEHAAYLERVSGEGGWTETLEELQAALQKVGPAERQKLLNEYKKLMDEAHAAQERLAFLTGKLAGLGIVPWERGWPYYSSWSNCAGVLITVVFLSFGAPFWYERLRELIQLRDVLKPRSDENRLDSEKKKKSAAAEDDG